MKKGLVERGIGGIRDIGSTKSRFPSRRSIAQVSVEGSGVRDLDYEATLTSDGIIVVKADGETNTEEVSRVESTSTAPLDSSNGLGVTIGDALGLQSFLIGGTGPEGCFNTLEVCGLGFCGTWAFG